MTIVDDLMPKAKQKSPRTAPDRPRNRAAAKVYYRTKIIDATIQAIADHGFAGVSVSRLMAYSDLSRGMVNLYFEKKESLLLEVLKYLALSYRESWQAALEKAGPKPAARLWSIVEHDIERGSSDQIQLIAWLSYRREAISHPNYRAYCDPREAGFLKAVISACTELVAEGEYEIDPQDAALGIVYLLEGLWIDWALNPRRFRKVEARRVCLLTLVRLFPKHFKEEE